MIDSLAVDGWMKMLEMVFCFGNVVLLFLPRSKEEALTDFSSPPESKISLFQFLSLVAHRRTRNNSAFG